MAICYVKAYFDWIEQTAALSDAERGRLFIAILEYARSGLEPKLDGREGILFPVFRAQLDRDSKRSAASSENGKKGGRPKTKQNLAKPNLTKLNLAKGNKEKEEEKEKEYIPPKSPQGETTKFHPPSVEEVRAYCQERRNEIDPQSFVDHYSARGWKYNGNVAMKDWKAAVRTWENNRREGGRDDYWT